jgi:hypothetical protein
MQHRWILACLTLLLSPWPAAAQRALPDAAAPPAGIRLGLTTLPPPFPLDYRLPAPESLLSARIPFTDWVRGWTTGVQRRLDADRERMIGRRFASSADGIVAATAATADARADTVGVPAAIAAEENLLGGTIGQYADLGMRITGLGELGGSWQRYKPCDPGLYLNCNPGLFPQLSPDVEFGVQVSGTISDRIHVNVDYDQRREDFTASNNINVYYQGLDEIVQRVEVGDVSLRLPAVALPDAACRPATSASRRRDSSVRSTFRRCSRSSGATSRPASSAWRAAVPRGSSRTSSSCWTMPIT